MIEQPGWYFDESKVVGIDYCSVETARLYDDLHQRFRDYEAECREVVETAGIDETSTVVDMGTGTGVLALHAARYCKRVIAVDVSPAMLQLCREKAENMGLGNVAFVQGGFLTYEHDGPLVDVVVSNMALHHLPDHWKQVGLERLFGMIRPGGRLLLKDVVFSSRVENHDEVLNLWIDQLEENAGYEMGREAKIHIKQEYSTYDWIMEGMLRQAGFFIEAADYRQGLMAVYLCRK